MRSNKFEPINEMNQAIEQIETAIDALGERAVFDQLFKQRRVVYGGFVRDAIAGVKPKDIDVVLSILHIGQFDSWMVNMRYEGTLNENNETMVWKLKDRLDVESYEVEDSPDDTMLGPVSDPDFDVNLLCYDGQKLYNWMDPGADISPILENIKKRMAIAMSEDVDPERLRKMALKGFSIH